MKKLLLPFSMLFAFFFLPIQVEAGTHTGFGTIELGCDYMSSSWTASGHNGTLKRDWTGCVSTFKATFNTKSGNVIPTVGRWLGKKGEWVQLNRVPSNYTLSWNGTGSISGGNFTYGPYFGIKPNPTGKQWIECYVTYRGGKPQSDWDRFTYIGTYAGFKHYKRWATWDGGFWVLMAVKQSWSWSGPCNIGQILNYWRTKTNLFNNNWYCKTFALAVETKADDGWFQATNINFPKASAPKSSNGNLIGIKAGAEMAFNIYPNPTSDGVVNIQGLYEDQSYNLQITNVNGQVVYTQVLKEHEMYDVNFDQIGKGLYFITVANEMGIQTQKVLVQ